MKNFNIFEVLWKIWFLGKGFLGGGGGGLKGGIVLKGRLGQLADLRLGLHKKEEVVFLRRGWYLNVHYTNWLYSPGNLETFSTYGMHL